jgi:hypothetical protein
MPSALVLGNGESRAVLDLHQLSKDITIIGCNAFHRDFIPNILICCDRKMVREAIANTSIERILTRKEWLNYFGCERISAVPDLPWKEDSRHMQPMNWGSGSYALLTAANLGFKEIYIAGFDLYGQDGLINNIYKNTENYLKDDRPCVDYSYWIFQQSRVFEKYQDTIFYIVNSENWKLPNEWSLPNVKLIKFSDIPLAK